MAKNNMLSTNEKNALRKKAASRILAGYGFTRHSWNIGTVYGFSFDNFLKHSSVYEQLQKLFDKEGIKYSTESGSMHLKIKISLRGDNLDKFVKLGEKTWKQVLKKYLPMIDELEKIQDKIDSRPLKSKSRFNYIVSRKCFADYLKKQLVDNEIVEDYENHIAVFSKLLEVQNNIDKVIAAIEENKSDFSKFNADLAVKLGEEYERLTGENYD